MLRREVTLSDVGTIGRVDPRRKWTGQEKAALLAEVEAAGGKVTIVARRHRISASLLYNWRAACKATAMPPAFIPLGVVGGSSMRATLTPSEPQPPRPMRANDSSAGGIEIVLPTGARVSVDAFVNEKALSRVLRAMKEAT